MNILILLAFLYLLILNAFGFLLMHIDKQKALNKQWRIPEATLMWVAALGGSIGSLLGMKTFRHKTRKPKFSIGIPMLLVLHIAIAVAISYYIMIPRVG